MSWKWGKSAMLASGVRGWDYKCLLLFLPLLVVQFEMTFKNGNTWISHQNVQGIKKKKKKAMKPFTIVCSGQFNSDSPIECKVGEATGSRYEDITNTLDEVTLTEQHSCLVYFLQDVGIRNKCTSLLYLGPWLKTKMKILHKQTILLRTLM